MDKQPKFLKLYEGVTSGTFMGREDGYPETKYVVYSDIRLLARDFGKQKDERYFVLVPMSAEQLDYNVKQELAAIEQEKQATQRQKDLAEFNRLKEKLGM